MGTWSAKPFGNDSAMDWLSLLLTSNDGVAAITSAFESVAADEDADVAEAEVAMAAAAVVAAAATNPIGATDAEVRTWIRTSGFSPSLELMAMASRSISLVQENSELRELWEESGRLGSWRKELDKLARCIAQAREVGVPSRRPKSPPTPRTLHGMLKLFGTNQDAKLRQKIGLRLAALEDPNAKSVDTGLKRPLTLLAEQGLLAETEQLLARGADPRLDSSQAFVEACANNHLELAKVLKAAGADVFHEHRLDKDSGLLVQFSVPDPNEPAQGHRYCLALFAVARRGMPSAVRYLQSLGANLRQTDLNGETLLHKSAEAGLAPMIRFLAAEGLDIDQAKREAGETPLHYAARSGKVEVVHALLDLGANPNAVDRFEGENHRWAETPLDVAELEAVKALLAAHGGLSASELA